MDKNALLSKVEEYVQAYRNELAKNDGSSLSTLAANATSFFEGLKDSLTHNEKAQKGMEAIKEHMTTFEKAIKEGDKKLSAKMMNMMEDALQELKKKDSEEKKDKEEKKGD